MSDVTCDQPTYDGAWRGIDQRYLTPSVTPTEYTCRRIRFPDEPQFRRALVELISRLSFCDTWDETPGGLSSIEAAALGSAIVDSWNESEDVCMIGAVIPVARDTLPANMLWCDGTQYNRVDYPELYSVLPAAFIVDADHFITPDLVYKFVRGSDQSADEAGDTGGEDTHTLTTAEMPVHTHTQNAHTHTQNAHTHTQDAHTHTQNAHTHATDAHSHFLDEHGGHSHTIAHTHTATTRENSTGGNSGLFMESTGTGTLSTISVGGISTANSGSSTTGITMDNTLVGVQSATATNQNATATNQNTTATNQNTTATNQNTGGGGAHNNLPSFMLLPYAIIAR